MPTEKTRSLSYSLNASVGAGIYWISSLLFEARSKTEEERRRERILTIILFGMVIFSGTSLGIKLFNLRRRPIPLYHHESVLLLSLFFVFFITLFVIARKGYHRTTAYVFLGSYFLILIHVSVTWGISLPMGILNYALLITMSSIIINTGFGMATMTCCIIALSIIGYHETSKGIIPEWKKYPDLISDVVEYSAVLAITAFLSALSNKEMERSLDRARKSEQALKEERNNLEVLVAARTQALRAAEGEQMIQLSRFAEFGKISAGLFHDLLNPLTAVSLSVEKLRYDPSASSAQNETRNTVENALNITRKMDEYMLSIRKQIQARDTHELFSIKEEILRITNVLRYRSQSRSVKIVVEIENDLRLYGNPLRFDQIVSNLLANAIDSYPAHSEKSQNDVERKVWITLSGTETDIVLSVRDAGKGISQEILEKVFLPFFTTKEKGIGLGLHITKDIVEQNFKGKIEFTSIEGAGTEFKITLPLFSEI